MSNNFLKNYWKRKRASWTFGLCMAGAMALGGIVTLDQAGKTDPEYENEYAVLEDDVADENDGEDHEPDAAVNASGIADEPESKDTEAEKRSTENPAYIDIEETVSDSVRAEETPVLNPMMDTIPQIEQEEEKLPGLDFQTSDILLWPSAGNILIDYSMDGTVFFPTLNQYKYNPALILGSKVGSQVVAGKEGIVKSITVDEVTGLTMVLDIGAGYELTYGQLKEPTVKEGESVERGTVIGYVSEPTRYFSKEGSNVYFKMTKDGTPVDPLLFLE